MPALLPPSELSPPSKLLFASSLLGFACAAQPLSPHSNSKHHRVKSFSLFTSLHNTMCLTNIRALTPSFKSVQVLTRMQTVLCVGLNDVPRSKDTKEAASSVATKLMKSAVNTECIPEKACAQRFDA